MNALSSPLDKISYDDVLELVTSKVQENVRLEFTASHENDKEILKKLSSFANTFGGRLVIGIGQGRDSVANAADGVERREGLSSQISSWCLQGLYPPLAVSVSPPIDVHGSARCIYVVEVSESPLAPHFIEGRAGCWVRSNDTSHPFQPSLATAQEIGWLSGRRSKSENLREQVGERFEHRWRSYAQWWGPAAAGGFLVQAFLGPTYPVTPEYRLQELREASDKALLATRTSATHRAEETHSQHGSIVMVRDRTNLRRLLDFSEFGFIGMSSSLPIQQSSRRSIVSDGMPEGQRYVNASHLLGSLVLATRLAARFQRVSTASSARFWLRNPEQHWLRGHEDPDGQFSFETRPKFDVEMEFEIPYSAAEVANPSDPIALAAFKRMAYGMGWPLADDPEAVRHIGVLLADAMSFLANY